MSRKSAKKMALWVSADSTTPPTVSDQVAYITSLNPTHSVPETDVSAAQDDYAVYVFGIPSGSMNCGGRVDLTSPDGQRQFEDWIADTSTDNTRLVRFIYDTDDPDSYTQVVAGITNLNQSGAHTSNWDFSATLRFASAPDFQQSGP